MLGRDKVDQKDTSMAVKSVFEKENLLGNVMVFALVDKLVYLSAGMMVAKMGNVLVDEWAG